MSAGLFCWWTIRLDDDDDDDDDDDATCLTTVILCQDFQQLCSIFC